MRGAAHIISAFLDRPRGLVKPISSNGNAGIRVPSATGLSAETSAENNRKTINNTEKQRNSFTTPSAHFYNLRYESLLRSHSAALPCDGEVAPSWCPRERGR